MTREEINTLQDIVDIYEKEDMYPTLNDKQVRTIKKAIKALEQEPCEDAVSRETMLNGLASIAKAKARSDAQKALMGRVMFFTEHLPPVTPKQRTGKWIWQTEDIYRCSECGEEIHVKEVMNVPQYICCPMCGAKMEGESE